MRRGVLLDYRPDHATLKARAPGFHRLRLDGHLRVTSFHRKRRKMGDEVSMVLTQRIFFPWKPEYSVQHVGIDSQHQRLVGLLNDLFAAMTEGQGRTAVQRTLTGLANYTKSHFSYEEQQMEKVGYPAMPQHEEQHRKLLQQVDRYVQDWNDDQSVSAVELGTFLKDWLLNHIGQTDRPLAEYLNPQG